MDHGKIKRALVSVSDKTGIVEFCRTLADKGVELLSTGGTARKLREAGLKVKDVAEHTGFPEMLDGRVKTLHPKVHGGLLARRDVAAHVETAREHGIDFIDMVVVNLYPFEETVARPEVSREEAVEQIDIGGPSMVRSAAKNHDAVAVVTDPADYEALAAEIGDKGGLSLATRRGLALKAFRATSWYDHAIAEYLAHLEADTEDFPARRLIDLHRGRSLRYGENPHQDASFYAVGRHEAGLGGLEQVSGKELSYNNILDLDAAMRSANEINDEPYAIVIKHTNPCGAAVGSSIAEAFARAYDCDPMSAFGGIVGLNRAFDFATAEQFIAGGKFIEAVVAPDFDDDAVEALVEKSKKKWRKSIRLVRASPVHSVHPPLEFRAVAGGMLMQHTDVRRLDPGEVKIVTDSQPDERTMNELLFAWQLCKHYKSNAICLTSHLALVGYGAGQTSRVDATEHALLRAGEKARGAVLASDAFFPFPDSVEKAAEAGVTAVIQPGGSVRDDQVIEACNKHGVAMVFTGLRHFRH